MRQDARIAKVTPNVLLKLGINSKEAKVKTTRSSSSSSLMNSQAIPWGVQRVGGANDGAGATAWILDTGIDLDHPDLNVDIANSASFIANEPADDGNGHGTHISGTIAAIDNNEDVVGVAAGTTVVAVKVCFDEAPQGDDQCPANSIINGIDYIFNNAQSEDIVNISIAAEETPENENALEDLEDAIINAANNGFQFTLIAGNAGDNANDYSPGRVEHPNVWTASAYDDTDTFASFSNYGNPPIEYGGPGVDVSSLNIGGGVTTMSGTSMAAPHIAGLLLAAPQDIIADGTVSGDPDGNSDPIAFNPPPPSVTISGPGSLLDGQQGTWSASVEYGSGSYSYQWYYKNPGSANWFPGGSSSSFSQTFHNTSSTTVPAYVKVEATNGSQQLDDEYTVLISGSSGGDCPPGHICS